MPQKAGDMSPAKSPKKLENYQKVLQESQTSNSKTENESVSELCFVSYDIVIEDSGMGIPKDK